MGENAKIDQNRNKALLGVTDDLNQNLVNLRVDPVTRRLKVSANISNYGLVYEWQSTKTYSLNNFVTYNGVIYVSLQNTNLNHTPVYGSSWWSKWAGILDTDGTLTADSDLNVASQKATKTYVDTSIGNLPKPVTYKGTIALANQFPTLAQVQVGWFYMITANVTDNDVTKTNTGLSFLAGDEIVWNGSTWDNLGSTALWDRTGINLTPHNVGDTINGLTLSSLATGFSIAGGTTPKTLTVDETHSLSDYVLLNGRAGGQTIYGGTLTTQALNLRSNLADLTSGAVNFLDTLEASSSTVGSVTMAGGLAVNKRIYALNMTVTNKITGSISGNCDGNAGGSSSSCTGNSATATKSTNLIGGNATTLLGSVPYQSNTDTTLFINNTTTTKKFLVETGSGTNGGVPLFDTIIAGDVPTLNQDTTGSAVYWKTSGTGKGAISGPAVGTTRTYTFPDADATILYSGGALGTPSSGTVTNLTGTASININGTVGATTATTGVFTTITANTGIVPNADDGAYLGTTALGFSDLFLATGAVINYANGNVTLTHSSGILTLGVGTLKITTPTNTATSVVTIDGTQTLTNKTLTSPNVNEAVALTSTSTKLNYISAATGTTGTNTGKIVFDTSPTFVTDLTTPLIKLSATSNQVVFQSAGVTGTLTWTPTVSNKTVTFPDRTLTIDNITTATTSNGTGFVKANGSVISFDNSTYLTGNQSITLSGAVTGSGTTSITTTIATPGTLTVSSTNSTATAHTHAITSSSAPGAVASILATDASGIIGSTGTRIVKGWFTNLQTTNAPIIDSLTASSVVVSGASKELTSATTTTTQVNYLSGATGTTGTNTTNIVFSTSPTITTPTFNTSITTNYLTTGSVLFAGSTANITQDNANLFWDNTNKRLGIGTTNPLYKTSIIGGTTSQVFFTGLGTTTLLTTGISNIAFGHETAAYGQGQLSYSHAAVSGSPLMSLAFVPRNNADTTQINTGQLYWSKTGGEDSTSFAIETHDNTSRATRFYINNRGNIGIGTTNPSYLLQLSKNNTPVLSIMDTSNGGPTIDFGYNNVDYSAAIAYSRGVSSALEFSIGGYGSAADKMVILNGGNVGIGTTSPISLCEIQGGLTTTGSILTLGSKETSTVANDVLGRINFYAPLDAAGTDANLVAGSIVAMATATFSSSVNTTSLLFQTGNSEVATTKMEITGLGNIVLGYQAALATNATDGFTYLPTSAGTPTGVPTAYTGKVAMEYDTTNSAFKIYNGAWKTIGSDVTTKGDLETYSTVPTRLGVGTDNYVLTSLASEVTGLKWQKVSALAASFRTDYIGVTNGTTTITATSGYNVYKIDSSGGTVTINLPAASGNVGLFRFKVINATNTITINRAGADTIFFFSSITSFTMSIGTSIDLTSDGTSIWLCS